MHVMLTPQYKYANSSPTINATYLSVAASKEPNAAMCVPIMSARLQGHLKVGIQVSKVVDPRYMGHCRKWGSCCIDLED
jgi:hypothetical protein